MKTTRNMLTGLMVSLCAAAALAAPEPIASESVAPPIAPRCLSADMDGDMIVTSLDFFLFINAWSIGKELADVNRDGAVDSQDFFDYLSVFLTPAMPEHEQEPVADELAPTGV